MNVDTLYFDVVKTMQHVFVIPIENKRHFRMLKNSFHWHQCCSTSFGLFVDYSALFHVVRSKYDEELVEHLSEFLFSFYSDENNDQRASFPIQNTFAFSFGFT